MSCDDEDGTLRLVDENCPKERGAGYFSVEGSLLAALSSICDRGQIDRCLVSIEDPGPIFGIGTESYRGPSMIAMLPLRCPVARKQLHNLRFVWGLFRLLRFWIRFLSFALA